jgi:YVTN family beta-propeller protein
LTVDPVLAGGENCFDETTCTEAGPTGFQFSISCLAGQVQVESTSCVDPAEAGTLSLLRVALRCFDAAQPDPARYTDLHGFSGDGAFADIVGDCTDYIAAAQWIRGNRQFEAQCAHTPNDRVPECRPLTTEDEADIADSVRLYAGIHPAPGRYSCYPNQGDLKMIQVRNRSLSRSFRGVIAGRYVCSTTTDPTSLTVCDDGVNGAPSRPNTGTYGVASGFSVARDSLRAIEVNVAGGSGFDYCCDYETPDEVPSATDCIPASECSPADIMCGSAAIFEVCRDGGDCAGPAGTYELLDRVVWLDLTTDVDPGGHSTVRPSVFADACRRFSFEGLGTERRTEAFPFGPAVPVSPADDACGAPGVLSDADFDGLVDLCDPVVAGVGPLDGEHELLLRRRLRNDLFFPLPFDANPGDGSMDQVFVHCSQCGVASCSACATADCSQCLGSVIPGGDDVVAGTEIHCGPNLLAETLAQGDDEQNLRIGATCSTPEAAVVRAGPNGALNSAASNPLEVMWVAVPRLPGSGVDQVAWRSSSGGSIQAASQPFEVQWTGYVSDGTANSMLVIDTVRNDGEIADGNPSPTNKFVNLNCAGNDEVIEASPPIALALRAEGEADREVFVLSEVLLNPPGIETRLFGFEVQTNRMIQTASHPSGVPLPGPAFALDVAEDYAGEAMAYVAWTPASNFGRIAVVNVDDPTDEAWGGVAPEYVTLAGEPVSIEVHRLDDIQRVFAYVTGVVCDGEEEELGPLGGDAMVAGPPFWCIEDCEGGPPPPPPPPPPLPPSRQLYLSVVDVTDPTLMDKVAEYKISHTEPGCSLRPPLANMGLAFSADSRKLFVANPDADRVDVYDTTTNQFLAQIPVGDEPVDVALVRPGGTQAERAYVVGHGDGIVRIVDVASQSLLSAFIPLNLPGQPPLAPVAIAARSDGLRLFTADSTHRTVSVLDIDPLSDTRDTKLKEIPTGPEATRLALLRLPSP